MSGSTSVERMSESGQSRQSWYKAYVKDTVRVGSIQITSQAMDAAEDEVFDEPADQNNNAADDYYKVMGRRPPSRSEDAAVPIQNGDGDVEPGSAKEGWPEPADDRGKPDFETATYHGVGVMYEEYKPPKKYVKAEEKRRSSSQTSYIVGCAPDKCKICAKKIYEMEKVLANHVCYHKQCFRCTTCNQLLSLRNYILVDGQLNCTSHRDIAQSKPKLSVDERSDASEKKLPSGMVRSMSMPTSGYQSLSGLSTAKNSEKPALAKVDECSEKPDELAAINEAFQKFKNMDAEALAVKPEAKPTLNKQAPDRSESRTYILLDDSKPNGCAEVSAANEKRKENSTSALEQVNFQSPGMTKIQPNDYMSQNIRGTPIVASMNGSSNVSAKPVADIQIPPPAIMQDERDDDHIPISEAMARFRTLEKQQLESELPGARREVRQMTPPREEPRFFLENRDVDAAIETKELVPEALTASVVTKIETGEEKKLEQSNAPAKNVSVQSTVTINSTVHATTTATASPATKPTIQTQLVDVQDGAAQRKPATVQYPAVKYTQNLLPRWKQLEQQALLLQSDEVMRNKPASSPATLYAYQRVELQKEQMTQVATGESVDIPPAALSNPMPAPAPNGKSENIAVNVNGVTLRRPEMEKTEGGKQQQQQQPRPSNARVLSFTKRPLAKFKELEARALADSMSPNAYQKKQTFKWDVKEPAVLHRPVSSNISGFIPDPQYTELRNSTNDTETTEDQPTSKGGREYFTVEYMQRILVQFRALEDRSRPPPLPTEQKRQSGVGLMCGVNRHMYGDRGSVTTEYAMEPMNCF